MLTVCGGSTSDRIWHMSRPESYHHGDLAAALVQSAIELLNEDRSAELSLRAVARRAGVSPAAPYRHFADREALVSSVAAVGYRELTARLRAASESPSSVDDVADIAVAYVRFALERSGLFRAMFAERCDPTSPDRVEAVEAIHEYLNTVVAATVSTAEPEEVATAMWALVHGLAFLYLGGKFPESSPAEVDARVRSTVRAVLGAGGVSRAVPAPPTRKPVRQ